MNQSSYTPSINYTPKLMKLLVDINVLVAQNSALLANIPEQIKKRQHIQNFLATLKLDRIDLIPDDVINIARNKPLSISSNLRANTPTPFIVKNLWNMAGDFAHIDSFDMSHLLQYHQKLLQGTAQNTAKFRTSGMPINDKNGNLIQMAMSANNIESHLNQVFIWAKYDQADVLIRSAILHFELLKTMPFFDGNGILARLWYKKALTQSQTFFEFLPIEETLQQAKDADYYDIFIQSTLQKDTTIFIEYIFSELHKSILSYIDKYQLFISNNDHVNEQVIDQVIEQLTVQEKQENEHVVHLENFTEKRKMRIITKLLKSFLADFYAEKTNQELMRELGLKHRPTFKQNYLAPALDAGLISMTQPNAPRSPTQAYVLTLAGIAYLQEITSAKKINK